MLWSPANDFNWSVDNFGATYTDTGLGINSPGHANANTKGANTNLLNGLAEDCYGLSICFCNGNTTTVIRRQLTDILIDPAAGVGNVGSSWSVLIANLAANSPCFGLDGAFGYWYYFPIYLNAGTAIGSAHQDLAATTQALRVAIRAYGKPSRPETVKVGTRVQTLGAVTGTTSGTAVTPGTGVKGSYSATLGTLNFNAFWWQLGILSADTTMTANGYLFDVAVNATNKLIVAENVPYVVVGTVERASMGAMGSGCQRNAVAGENVYVRGAGAAAPDTTMTAVVYAVGA